MASSEHAPHLSDDVLLDMIYKIFGLRRPNALGESAFKLDDKGLYTRAINHPVYYLHIANKKLFASLSPRVAKNVCDIRHAIILGQGPGEVFSEQEALLLAQMPSLQEITTIEFSEIFNEEAKGIVNCIAHKLGHSIDILAKRRPELAGLSRSNFEHVVRWNAESYDAEQVLRVIKPFRTEIVFSDEDGRIRIKANEYPGDEFWIINSFMPPVEMVIDDAQQIGLSTIFALDDPDDKNMAGFTMHLMRSLPGMWKTGSPTPMG